MPLRILAHGDRAEECFLYEKNAPDLGKLQKGQEVANRIVAIARLCEEDVESHTRLTDSGETLLDIVDVIFKRAVFEENAVRLTQIERQLNLLKSIQKIPDTHTAELERHDGLFGQVIEVGLGPTVSALVIVRHGFEENRALFVLFVFEQLEHELETRVLHLFILVLGQIDGKELPGLDLHQTGREDEELTAGVRIEAL